MAVSTKAAVPDQLSCMLCAWHLPVCSAVIGMCAFQVYKAEGIHTPLAQPAQRRLKQGNLMTIVCLWVMLMRCIWPAL